MYDKTIELLRKKLRKDGLPITPDTDIVAETGINSLELVDLICCFEDEFDIKIADRDIRKLRYVRDIVSYIEEKTKLS